MTGQFCGTKNTKTDTTAISYKRLKYKLPTTLTITTIIFILQGQQVS